MERRRNSVQRICCSVKLWSSTVAAIILLACAGTAGAGEPLLVMQPPYPGMQFYVSQVQGLPPHWYVTFDGYPVWKNADGVWFYGAFSETGPISTGYVVGSVIPSIAGLTPYAAVQAAPVQAAPVWAMPIQAAPVQAAPVRAMPVQAAPVRAMPIQAAPVRAAPIQAAQPVFIVPAAPVYAVPEWAFNPNFTALGGWRGNVDRVGILRKPAAPVAWKGHLPQVIYAWTGTLWYQIAAREGERPGEVLRNNLYLLTRLVNQNQGVSTWSEMDAFFLANQTAQWGYIWIGDLTPALSAAFVMGAYLK